MKTLLMLILFTAYCFAQTDWQHWDAKSVSYELHSAEKKDYSVDSSSSSNSFLSILRNGYYFLISDLDGDNCPFNPSCSRFFVDAVKETNLFQGILMFADRFTRDLNFLRSHSQYQLKKNGKFFDPAYNYTLNLQKIKFQ